MILKNYFEFNLTEFLRGFLKNHKSDILCEIFISDTKSKSRNIQY